MFYNNLRRKKVKQSGSGMVPRIETLRNELE